MAAALSGVYSNLLVSHPAPTRMVTAASLAIAGDAVAQKRGGQRPRDQLAGVGQAYSKRRASAIVAVEVVFRGLMQQRILLWIIRTFQGGALRSMSGGLLSQPQAAILERLAFNQLVVSPCVYYPLFYSFTGPTQGLNVRQTFERAKASCATILGWNLCFWVPVQLVQFAMVPTRYKVPYICVASFVWNIILSTFYASVSKLTLHNDPFVTALHDYSSAMSLGTEPIADDSEVEELIKTPALV